MKYKIIEKDNIYYPFYKKRKGLLKYEWRGFGDKVKFKEYKNALKFIDILEFGKACTALDFLIANQLVEGFTELLLLKEIN